MRSSNKVAVVVVVLLAAVGWGLFARQFQTARALSTELVRVKSVAPPVGYSSFRSSVAGLGTRFHAFVVPASIGGTPVQVLYEELYGLLTAALANPSEESTSRWETLPLSPGSDLPVVPDLPDDVKFAALKGGGVPAGTEFTWVNVDFNPTLTIEGRSIKCIALISKIGSDSSTIYLQTQDGQWLRAASLVSARFLEAFALDQKEKVPRVED